MALFSRSKNAPVAPEAAGPGSSSDAGLEARVKAVGAELLDETSRHRAGVMSRAFWSQRLIDWAMKDEAFKVQLFRFVDTFPTLKTPEQVHDHLADYMAQPGVTPPPGMGVGMKAGGLLKGTMARTVSSQITSMAERFIAGEDASQAAPYLRSIWSKSMAFSVDLLGEACVSDREAEAYRARYLALVHDLAEAVAPWPEHPGLERDHLGQAVPRANVSIKISALYARTDAIDLEGSLSGLLEALRPTLESARDHGVLLNFDMESHALKDLTLELFMRAAEAVDFPAGLALQAYLRSGEADAQRIIEWSQRTGRQVAVRLVKGAYWDYETVHAEEMGWPVPVWSRKRHTDACFERMAELLIDATPRAAGEGGTHLALGSHNLRSIAAAMASAEAGGLPEGALEVQCLRGMADDIKAAMVARGVRVREYVPVGQMIPGMAYLVRRLLENTSNESWLLASSMDDASAAALMASPHEVPAGEGAGDPGLARIAAGPERHALSPAVEGLGDGRPFFTEPMRDFAEAAQRAAFAAAIAGARVPVVASDGTLEDADRAITGAALAFPGWRARGGRARAEVLVEAAAAMRARRDELSGVVIREAGKPWREADADVCEAIDFCEYYARLGAELDAPRRLGAFVGELNQVSYQPRGVAVVISPWNFPLAIACGMTTAALVTGNTVVLKPAEQTPGIARVLAEILWEAGAPREVLHFLPAPGETVGAALVRDPRVALIAFTGSKAVGLDILEAAGHTPEGQGFVKRVVCEMGGKNAIIVDASADLDEAVLGVRGSAFGYSGQKCSACSRVIVLDTAYEAFLRRLAASTESLVLGDPLAPGTDVGPVIDREAAESIRRYVAIGHEEGRLVAALEEPPGLEERVGRPYVAPHVFADIGPEHRLAREEIFGPVLAVMRASSFDEALALANDHSYKLTGAVYSRKPAHLEQARRELRVGNLYLNRGSTGALVGRQPFGGFGLSGVGSKAGGADYLLQFVEPRSVTENTVRRGFAPGLE